MNPVAPSGSGANVPIEAVWAGAAAVVLAALIAAIASYLRTRLTLKAEHRRLAIRLAAEQERLEAQLGAEADRQLKALSHDRAMRDTDEIRGRLDEVIDMGEAALSAVCSAHDAYGAGDPGGTVDQLTQAKECLGQSGYKERRLRLRIGFDHAVINALAEYRMRIQALRDLVETASENGQPISPQSWHSEMGQVADRQVAVIQIGMETVGARLDDAHAEAQSPRHAQTQQGG